MNLFLTYKQEKQMDPVFRQVIVQKLMSEHVFSGKSVLVVGKRCSGKTYMMNFIRANITGYIRVFDDCESTIRKSNIEELITSQRRNTSPQTLIFCVTHLKKVPVAARSQIDHIIEITPKGITYNGVEKDH